MLSNADDIVGRIKAVLETIRTREQQIKQIKDDIEYSKTILAELLAQQAGGNYRVSNRKAKVGDTIIIIDDEYSLGLYKIGDVLKVLARHGQILYVDKTFIHDDNENNVRVLDGEYVVLEPKEAANE